MAGLDRSKPFATVFGDEHGRIYEQDGHYYRGDGSLWQEGTPKAEAAAAKAPASKRAAVKPAEPAASEQDAQLAAQLGGAA
ncbi:MAG: hypothetical protein ACXWVD_00245 [Telluria sp.]